MDLDFDFSGTTKLKAWWKQVKANFQTIEDEHNDLSDTVDTHEETTATGSVEGHVKLYDTPSSSYTVSSGLAATPAAVQTRAPANHRSSNTTYGLGTNSYYGHVKLSDSVDDSSHTQTGGVAASPYAVKQAYDLANTANTAAESAAETASSAASAVDNRAPIYHALSGTNYGAGTDELYGHVKLYDEPAAGVGVDSGTAATPLAVYRAYTRANAAYNLAEAALSALTPLNITAVSYEDIVVSNTITAGNYYVINAYNSVWRSATGSSGSAGLILDAAGITWDTQYASEYQMLECGRSYILYADTDGEHLDIILVGGKAEN